MFAKFILTVFRIRNFGVLIFSSDWAKVNTADASINPQKLSNKVLKTISRIASPDAPRDLSELNHVTTICGRSRVASQEFSHFLEIRKYCTPLPCLGNQNIFTDS